MDTKARIAQLIKEAMDSAYPTGEGLPSAEEILALIEIPPDSSMGDYAFPCFRLSKALRAAPPVIATALAAAIDVPDFVQAQTAGGYLNFFLNRAAFAKELLPGVLAKGDAYGASDMGKGKTVCLDYSSINIAKRFHIGHLSTTMIGHSLNRIYQFLGYHTVGINHLGDWGTQFGKLIAAYLKWGNREMVEKGGVTALTELYVRFENEAAKDNTLEDEGRAWFKAVEDGNAEALEIFNWFKDITLRDTQHTYELLGVSFDSYAGESFYSDKTDRVVKELQEKNLLTVSDGASIVDLEAYKMPPCIILKRDGATLYTTRDIAAALYRQDTYHFDQCLYVVAYQQDLHFRQLFKVIELMGYPWAKGMVHVSFGMISYEGQALSTRRGHVVYLDELLDRAIEKALEIIKEKSPGLDNKEEVARQVGVGAVIYSALQNNRIKDVDFSWDRVLTFDGESGPYVQYTHAKCCSLLRKAGEVELPTADYGLLEDDESQEILRQISRFPEVVLQAAERYEPYMITRAITDLAQAYNKFYVDHRILGEAPALAAARVDMTRAVRNTIKTGLHLIGMEAPERM